ncbi:hypothetical protein D3C74_369950 [compost metagenome]
MMKVTQDNNTDGMKAARTLPLNSVLMLIGVNSKPSSVLRSFSPAKLLAVRMLEAITGMMRNKGANIYKPRK